VFDDAHSKVVEDDDEDFEGDESDTEEVKDDEVIHALLSGSNEWVNHRSFFFSNEGDITLDFSDDHKFKLKSLV